MTDYIVKLKEADPITSADVLNYGYQTKSLDEAIISQSPLDIRRYYSYSGDGSDWGCAINQALADGHKYIGIPTGETFSCKTPIVIPEPASTTARADIYICGIGGMGKLGSSAPVDLISTYDTTTANPTFWTRGLVFRDLELDGSDVGICGLKLHKCAQSVSLQNCYVHNFTVAQVVLVTCLETSVQSCYIEGNQTNQPAYGIYAADGTTHTYHNVTIRLCQIGYMLGGDAVGLSGNNDGTDDAVWFGGVIESCRDLGIHISAGDRVRFYATHVEDVGYGASSTDASYCVKVSNEGGETPRNALFDHCTFAVNATHAVVNHKIFNLTHGNRTEFRRCQDGGTRGGTIGASANYTLIESGTYTEDFRIAAGNITDSGTETTFVEWDTSGYKIVRGASDYFQVTENPYIRIVRAVETNNAFASKESGSSTDRFYMDAKGLMNWAGSSGSSDVQLSRSMANQLQTGSGDLFFGQGGLITKVGTSNVNNPPTEAQIDAIFGAGAAAYEDGYIGIINDNGASTLVWLCVKTEGFWFYTLMTKAV